MRNTAAGIQSEIAKGAFRPHTALTNMALAYYQNAANYFAKALFPTCPVSLSSDNYYEFSKEDLLRDNWSRKPAYGKVDPTVVGESMKPYVCQVDQMIMGIDQIRQTDLSRRQGPTTMQPKQQRVKTIVGRIKDEPEVRVVCHTKSSLAPEGKAIAFRLDKNNGFEWIGEYDISADELLNGEGKGQKTRKAKEFLLEILADGGMAQKKIEEEAEKLGIKKKTLRNAKMELGIDSVKRGNQWYWMLSE